jgi:histidine triad (HIT) family protein
MQEPSIFTLIINGDIPSHKIYEDDQVLAFLEIHPIMQGHTLVVPKKQIDHIWDLDEGDYEYLWSVTKKIGTHIREVMGSPRVGITVEGFGIPHAHIHLMPIYHGNDLKKQQNKDYTPSNEELEQVAAKLRM